MAACAVERDASRVPYLPHEPTELRTTPGGHRRDAGPFESVKQGYVTEEELDAAVDGAFSKFSERFPDLISKLKNPPVTLNDDYALWVNDAKSFASGAENQNSSVVSVCIWARGESAVEPTEPAFIKRRPGPYFGVMYTGWRWTKRPLCPALVHELLHKTIGDGAHKDPRWKLADQP